MARSAIEVRDPDEATELLCSRYVRHRPSITGNQEGFVLGMSSAAIEPARGRLRVDRVRHSMGMRVEAEPATDLILAVPLEGHISSTTGRDSVITSPFLTPYWRESVAQWEDVDCAAALLDLDGVRRVGAEIAGLDPAEVEFTGSAPLSAARGELVAASLAYVRLSLLGDASPVTPLLGAEAFRHLAVTLLAAFPNTTHTIARVGRDTAEPAVVRRATAFMDRHAREDVDLVRVADAAGVGPRGLQSAFRRHRGQTPLEYLRRARLEGAHRDLQAGDPTRGDTVAGIAARWGFRHPGRFAVEYGRLYGRSPAQTLRR